MKKFLFSLAAIFALLVSSVAFTSCTLGGDGDDDDYDYDNDNGRSVFESSYTDEDGDETVLTLTAENGIFILHRKSTGEKDGFTMKGDMDICKGTYSGNASTDGDIALKLTHMVNMDSPEAMQKIMTMMITARVQEKDSLTITNQDFPLQAIPAEEQEELSLTISNGQFTMSMDEDDAPATFTRK